MQTCPIAQQITSQPVYSIVDFETHLKTCEVCKRLLCAVSSETGEAVETWSQRPVQPDQEED